MVIKAVVSVTVFWRELQGQKRLPGGEEEGEMRKSRGNSVSKGPAGEVDECVEGVGSVVWRKWAGGASLTLAGLNHMWQKPDLGLTSLRLYSAFPSEAWELISTRPASLRVGISCFLFGSQLFATSFVPTGITGTEIQTGRCSPKVTSNAEAMEQRV